jgi:hypothetical protein
MLQHKTKILVGLFFQIPTSNEYIKNPQRSNLVLPVLLQKVTNFFFQMWYRHRYHLLTA